MLEKIPFLFIWALKLLVTWPVTIVAGGDGRSTRLVFLVFIMIVSASSLIACRLVKVSMLIVPLLLCGSCCSSDRCSSGGCWAFSW